MLTDDEKENFHRITSAYPEEDMTLLRSVHKASRIAKGMMKTKAVWIVACCLDGQPKIGWREDAREVIASVQ